MKRMIAAVLFFFFSLTIALPLIARDTDRDYRDHHGYRERPYGQRHYGPYDHEGQKYLYHGHWRSWDDWDRYRREHPRMYEHGRYYREGGHLMFRVCDPATGNCFFFSIGR
jgi:hypothetical protein